MGKKFFALNAEALENLDDENLDKLVDFLNAEAGLENEPSSDDDVNDVAPPRSS